jgi:anti-sigma B factor antagonist
MTPGGRLRRQCIQHRDSIPDQVRLPEDEPPSRAGKVDQQVMDDYGLTVEVRHEPGHVLVTVAGEVDIATAPRLQDRLAALAATGRPLIVDLDRVTFIDASGLGVLARVASQARAQGASLHAVCARHLVRRLFAITGLDRQVPLARTVTDAGGQAASLGSVAPGRALHT